MREIIFTEDQLPNSEELKRRLFGDEKDPRSVAYIRFLKRPEISWWKIIISVMGTAVFFALVIWGVRSAELPILVKWLGIVSLILLYVLLHLKRICICAVRIYQRYAPDSLRNKCRFEPSCSEYMILAIQKYGSFRGLRKGINRLKRCNVDGGGFDDP